jgi:dephospho-CoA kinase
MPVIGLIGGIGSGKSLVAALLAERGAKVISGDRLGHEALEQPDIRDRVAEGWGSEILNPDGSIARPKLGKIVFASFAERKKLEALVFPWIERRIREEMAAVKKKEPGRLIVLDAAIMLEAGWSRECDWFVFVDSPADVRLGRLAQARGWTSEQVQAREAAQLPLDEKKQHADFVLENTGSVEELSRQLDTLLERTKASR